MGEASIAGVEPAAVDNGNLLLPVAGSDGRSMVAGQPELWKERALVLRTQERQPVNRKATGRKRSEWVYGKTNMITCKMTGESESNLRKAFKQRAQGIGG